MENEKSQMVKDMIISIGNKTMVCRNTQGIPPRGFWKFNDTPTSLLLVQMSLISVITQLVHLCLKHLGQSLTVSQIFGGMIFGRSLLGYKKQISKTLFPFTGAIVIETIATFGLMYFLFAIGVKMDIAAMLQPERKAMTIGFSIFFFSLLFPSAFSLALSNFLPLEEGFARSLPYFAASQSISSFPVVASLLTELKIQNTEIGRLALSCSMFCDILGMTMTAFTLAFLGNKSGTILVPVLAVLSAVSLLGVIAYILRPIMKWMRNRSLGRKQIKEIYVFWILLGVLVSAFLSELFGQHYVLGPMIFGLVVPDGPPLGTAMVAKVDLIASGLLYPTFISIVGLKANLFGISLMDFLVVGSITLSSFLVKIGAVMLIAQYYQIQRNDSLVLGLILNSKGIMELNIYNIWKQNKLLSDQAFSLAVISVIIVTAIIAPLIKFLYDPSKQYLVLKRSTIQHIKHEAEFKILVGIQSPESVSTVINVLEASHATEENPIAVTALILIELVNTVNTLLTAAYKPNDNPNESTSISIQILNALRQYEIQNEGLASVYSYTSVSRYETMHDDVCRVALNCRSHIVIMPFHKRWTIDGSIGLVNKGIRNMNLLVLERAPCSVGILIDRGIMAGKSTLLTTNYLYHVAVIFIGGPDDAESLAYGSRMATHERVDLTVARFLLFGTENSKERKRDSDLLYEYRQLNIGNDKFVIVDTVVRDAWGLSKALKEMMQNFDLILVGSQHDDSPILRGLAEWNECPELGVIGDMLSSSDIEGSTSVLVIQQHRLGHKQVTKGLKALNKERIKHEIPHEEAAISSWSITVDRNDRHWSQ